MEGEQQMNTHSCSPRHGGTEGEGRGGQEVNDAKHPLGRRLAMILARGE